MKTQLEFLDKGPSATLSQINDWVQQTFLWGHSPLALLWVKIHVKCFHLHVTSCNGRSIFLNLIFNKWKNLLGKSLSPSTSSTLCLCWHTESTCVTVQCVTYSRPDSSGSRATMRHADLPVCLSLWRGHRGSKIFLSLLNVIHRRSVLYVNKTELNWNKKQTTHVETI